MEASAFFFGYALTSLPLLRAGFTLAAVIPIALATDTFSIAVMEIVDNGIMLIIPGAMESGVGDVLFWGALSFALAIAGMIAFPVNRWLITRGKGHAVLHETGIHGRPPTKVAAVAFLFGSTVLVAEAFDSDSGSHDDGTRLRAAGAATAGPSRASWPPLRSQGAAGRSQGVARTVQVWPPSSDRLTVPSCRAT